MKLRFGIYEMTSENAEVLVTVNALSNQNEYS